MESLGYGFSPKLRDKIWNRKPGFEASIVARADTVYIVARMFAPNLRIIWLLFGWYESEKKTDMYRALCMATWDSFTISFNASIFTSSHTTINITNV